MTPLLETALQAAHAAGQILLDRLPLERAVTFKGQRDIVTDADFAAQQAVAAIVAARFPEHAVLAEEGLHAADLAGPGPVWIVDPLDGTTNYSRRFPGFSVALAVAEAGQVIAGVTHDPLRQETFYAERRQGAFVRRGLDVPQPLRVSATTALDQSLAGLDWARDPAVRAQVLDALGRVGGPAAPCGRWAAPRWAWPTSPPAGWTCTFTSRCSRGTPRPAGC